MTGQLPRAADADLAARFPGWDIMLETDGSLHAWLVGTDPPLVLRGADEQGLRDQIRITALQLPPQ